MSHSPVQQEIRLHLVRAAQSTASAATQIEEAIAALDRGDNWREPLTDARLNLHVAADSIPLALGMGHVAALVAVRS